MSLQTHFEFLFIGREDEGFARNYVHLEGEDRTTGKGQLFINFQMGSQFFGEEIGETIFSTIKQHFFSGSHEAAGDAYGRFEAALKAANARIVALQERKDIRFAPNLNVVVALLIGNELFLTQAGEAEAYLIRRKHVSVISEGLGDGTARHELFFNIASGSLEDSDTIVFSSVRLLRYITEIDLGKLFSNYDLAEAMKELQQLVHKEVTERTAILAMDIHKAQTEKVLSEIPPQGPGSPELKPQARSKLFDRSKLTVATDFLWQIMGRFKGLRQGRPKWFPKNKVRLPKNRLGLIVVVLIVVLLGGVYALRKNTYEKKKLAEYTSVLQEVKESLSIAETQGHYSKSKAGALLDQAAGQASTVLQNGYLRGEVSLVLQEIQKQRDALDNIKRIPAGNEKVLVDLSSQRPNVSALGLIRTKDGLFVYEYNALYEIVLKTVRSPLTIDAKEVVTTGTYFSDQDSVVFLTKSNRLIEFKDGQFTFMDTDDTAWHSGVAVGTFSNKLYMLDPAANQIWKYTRKRDRYSAAETYNVDGQVQDGMAMAIDGTVYVLKKNGSIERLYRGLKETYTIKDMPLLPLKDPKKIYTERDMNQLYVLEPSSSRVLLYNKETNGSNFIYSGQYVFEGLKDLRDLTVDQLGKKLYVMDGGKIYEVGL